MKKSSKRLEEIDTPAVLVREAILVRNITDMISFARAAGVDLRPSLSAHKSPRLAKIQVNEGAKGIAVNTIRECIAMIREGIEDIHCCTPIKNEEAKDMVANLGNEGRITYTLTCIDDVKELIACMGGSQPMKVLVKVALERDSQGVMPDQSFFDLLEEIDRHDNLTLHGIMVDPDQVNEASDPVNLNGIGVQLKKQIQKLQKMLHRNRRSVPSISVGHTGVAKIAGMFDGVGEIRPGRYVFNDQKQVEIGVALPEDCALTVLASIRPTGSKSEYRLNVGSDILGTGAHGIRRIRGNSSIAHNTWRYELRDKEMFVVDEKGILKDSEIIEIIPSCARTIIASTKKMFLVRNEKVQEEWPLSLF